MQNNDTNESTNDVGTLLQNEENQVLVTSNLNLKNEPFIHTSMQYKQSTNLSMSDLSTLLTR